MHHGTQEPVTAENSCDLQYSRSQTLAIHFAHDHKTLAIHNTHDHGEYSELICDPHLLNRPSARCTVRPSLKTK